MSENNNLKDINLDIHSYRALNNEYEEYERLKLITSKKKFSLPFIVYILIFTLLLFIASIISLIVVLNNKQIYYKYDEDIYLKPDISEHNYSKLTFDNELEIVLVQVQTNDSAGGAISFERGYLDKKYEPGLLSLAFRSLRYNDLDTVQHLNDYMGDLQQAPEEFYSSIYFTVLNSGFQRCLENFKDYTSYDKANPGADIDRTLRRMKISQQSFSDAEKREKYLIEFLVYNVTDENGSDINRQGTYNDTMERFKGDYKKIFNIMSDMFNPKKVKLIFYSHFKMSLMKKYLLRYLQELTRLEVEDEKEEKEYEIIKTNQIIYHQIKDNENNYIKINYYIKNDKVDLNQLYIDSGYFNYLKYILDETHEDSLFYKLTHPLDKNGINIKNISCSFEVVLKNRIRFSIIIKLNHYSYNHIIDIIKIVYDYMEKIKTHINNLSPEDERVSELYFINKQNFTFSEDLHSGEFYKNKAKDLFYRDERDYFLKEVWIPPDLNQKQNNIKYYINELTLENSVIIIGLSDYTIQKYKLINTNISFIFNNLKQTNFSNITYSTNDLSKLNISVYNNANNNVKKDSKLVFHKNEFISKYSSVSEVKNETNENNGLYTLIDDSNELVKFYWLKDTSFKMPKSFIITYFFHPFLRPNSTNITEVNNIYFHLMLYLSYIQREVDFVLADAVRAGNTFRLGYVENYLYVDIFSYSDLVEKILIIIKEIITKNANATIINNYHIYKDHVLENLLNFGNIDEQEVLKYEFYRILTEGKNFPPIYNHYNFPRNEFLDFDETKVNSKYLCGINIPVLYLFILGYYEKTDAEKIFNFYSNNFTDTHFKSILDLAKYDISQVSDNPANDFISKSLYRYNLTETKIFTNYTKISTRRKYAFMTFVQFSDHNRIIVEMFKRIVQDNNRAKYHIDILNQKNIYLRISMGKNNITNDVINELITMLYDKEENMTKLLDPIGNRYYYLERNLENKFTNTPYNMENAAIDFSYNQVYNRHGAYPYPIDNKYYKKFIDTIKNFFDQNKEYCEFSNQNKSNYY